MFNRAERKLRELNQHFEGMLKSKSVDEFEGCFSAFLSAARSFTMALQKDAGIVVKEKEIINKGTISGFAEWYLLKQEEMRNDELCKFFKNVRDEDLHTGDTIVRSSTTIQGPLKLTAPKGGILLINDRGVYDVFNEGTADERKVKKVLEPHETHMVGFSNPPTSHLGKNIQDTTPATLCKTYKNYLQSILSEAKRQFQFP